VAGEVRRGSAAARRRVRAASGDVSSAGASAPAGSPASPRTAALPGTA
jgi:hypothetical protein